MSRLTSLIFLIFLFPLLIISLAPGAASAADPRIRWEQLETEHFKIIYDSRHYPLAAQYARFAEQAFQATTPMFGIWPKKTRLVLNDATDQANGFATGVPYPLISSFPVLPSSLESISDYGNWGLELITHEYTHILEFEPAGGIMKPLRYLFGSIVRPNILLPRWYLEGLAVEMETRYSSFGRLRSANYLSIPRAMVEEGSLRQEDIARINEISIPDWPGGIRPYLMGALVLNEMARLGGDTSIGEINTEYGRRLPFFINGPVEARLGVDYAGLLAKAYDRVETNARKQIELIQASGGESKGERLAQLGYFSHSPAISPDGTKLAFIGRSHNVDSFIMLAERPALEHPPTPTTTSSSSSPGSSAAPSFATAKPKPITDGTSINRVSWLPDSRSFIFDSIDTFERWYEFSDLWRYDLASKKQTQLTKGLRAREPAVSPDGAFIVFVQNLAGSTRLAAVDIDGKNLQVLLTPPLQTRLSRPEFISKTEIVFTEKRDDGSESLKRATLIRGASLSLVLKGEPQSILTQFKPIHFPRMTREGLLFVSDRTGVANLYLANANLKDARAVSNTTTRLLTGEIDPLNSDLIHSRLAAAGPQIHVTKKEAWNRVRLPPQVGPLVDYQWPTFTSPEIEVQAERAPYNPLPDLVPHYWLPFVFVIPDGAYITAGTASSDAVGRHAYSLSIAYDTLTQRPSFFGSYSNQVTDVPLTASFEDSYDYLYSSGLRRHNTAAGLLGKFFLPSLSENWRGGLGWIYQNTEILDERLVRNGAQVIVSWSDTSQKGLEISPEKGGAATLSYTQFFPGLGDLNYKQIDTSLAYYFSRWLPERHVVAFFANASIAPGLEQNFLGRTTVGGNFQSGFINRGFLMRGYPSGVFIGRNMVSGTLEYRLPLSYEYRGFGTSPFFLQRWHAAVFGDALTLDGLSYDSEIKLYRREKLGTFFVGTGVEIKADATIFYHLPIQFIFGLYYGLNERANPNGVFPFLGFGLL